MRKVILFVFLFLNTTCHAITWGETEVADPILAGETCQVKAPNSYGGYIYQYPSRFDFVFWPMTDSNSIWYCEKSGYMSFMKGFGQIADEEKPEIFEYINNHTFGDNDIISQIEYMSGLNELRNLSDSYRIELLRVYARYYQSAGLLLKANLMREEAFAAIEASLNGSMEPLSKMEYLYVAANYARQFDDIEASEHYLEKLNALINHSSDGDHKNLVAYLNSLIPLTELITPGGKLEPSVETIEKFNKLISEEKH